MARVRFEKAESKKLTWEIKKVWEINNSLVIDRINRRNFKGNSTDEKI
jgi:hypothetical protein